jgi:hypothetical protein
VVRRRRPDGVHPAPERAVLEVGALRIEIDDPLVAYISLTEDRPRHVAHTVSLAGMEEGAEVPALEDIVLDFDGDGRLVGIEVLRPARWLPPDLLDGGEGT